MEKFSYEIETEPKEPVEKHHKVHKKTPGIKFYFFNIFLGLIIVAIVAVLGVGLFCNLKDVDHSDTLYSDINPIRDTIIADAPLENAVLIWGIHLFKGVGDYPFVEKVSVKLTGPNSIYIDVKEKEIEVVAAVSEEQFAYLDKSGVVKEISKDYIDGLTLISGVEIKSAETGKVIGLNNKVLKNVLDLIKYLDETDYRANNIIFNPDGTFGFESGDIYVDIGTSENLENKIRRLPYILSQLEGEHGILHMSAWSHDNSDIIFERN